MARITRRTFIETAAAAAGTTLAASVAGRLDVPVGAAPAVPTRPFGRTGVQVSMAGLGGGARFYEPVPTDEAGAELVRQAIDRGITYIETCANYGPDEDGDCSERRIGLAMKTHRARAFLETKTDQRDYDGAMREMERSLRLLCTDHIDLMLHHNLATREELDQIAGPNGAEKAVRKLVDQKVIRFRGFSCHDPKLTLEAVARLQPDALQAPDQRDAGAGFRGGGAPAREEPRHRRDRHESRRPRVLPQGRRGRLVRLALQDRQEPRAAPLRAAARGVRSPASRARRVPPLRHVAAGGDGAGGHGLAGDARTALRTCRRPSRR